MSKVAAAPALSIRHLAKTFDQPAVDDLSLTIWGGEFYALLGPNGAGKTTTLRMVSGLLKPDAGSISVCGIDTAKDAIAAKRVLAWVPDEPLIYDKLTPMEYLAFVAGLWGMDGDVAPLDKLYEVSKGFDCAIMVDDAHGEGVLGTGGRGIVDHFNLHGKVDIEVGTLSKAFGVVGGVVAGDPLVVEWLRQRGRPFLFSSAMTVPDVAACLAAVELLEESTELVDKLWENARYFQSEISKVGFDTGLTTTPITPIMLGEARLAQEFSAELFRKGVFAMAIGFPTVPRGKARIRVMISASHSKNDLDQGIATFRLVARQLGIIG